MMPMPLAMAKASTGRGTNSNKVAITRPSGPKVPSVFFQRE